MNKIGWLKAINIWFNKSKGRDIDFYGSRTVYTVGKLRIHTMTLCQWNDTRLW